MKGSLIKENVSSFQGTVARVRIGQPLMSVRTYDRHKGSVIEALRRTKFKFPGRQKVIRIILTGFCLFYEFAIFNIHRGCEVALFASELWSGGPRLQDAARVRRAPSDKSAAKSRDVRGGLVARASVFKSRQHPAKLTSAFAPPPAQKQS